MDLNTFKAGLNARLSEFNDNEEGYTYYIASDARNYYQATDAAKLQGCESVTISVTCSDGATLGQGTTQYKCRTCGKSLNAHSKGVCHADHGYGERTGLVRAGRHAAGGRESGSRHPVAINAFGERECRPAEKIAEASVEDAAVYRQQYNANKTR